MKESIDIMGCGIMAVALLALVGHATRMIWLYQWLSVPGMAVNTALVFWVVGLCLLLLNRRIK